MGKLMPVFNVYLFMHMTSFQYEIRLCNLVEPNEIKRQNQF